MLPRERGSEHAQESVDVLALAIVDAQCLASRRFAERRLADIVGRMGVDGCVTRFAIVRRDRGGRLVVRLRVGDLHRDTQDPLRGRSPIGRHCS